MSPLQLAVLSQIDTVDRRAIADLAAGLGAEIGRSKSRTLNILLRALNRIADSEQRIAEKDELIAHLQSQALTDPLTGLINRRGFEDSVRKAVASAHRFDESGLLAYIDLDEFKPINDRFGHEAGDVVLKYVAEFLHNSVRATDTVSRLGGDEFALLFAQTTPQEGERRARTLQLLLNASHISVEGNLISISASMGVAAFVSGSDARGLMRRADAAMYMDKGRRQRDRASRLKMALAAE